MILEKKINLGKINKDESNISNLENPKKLGLMPKGKLEKIMIKKNRNC